MMGMASEKRPMHAAKYHKFHELSSPDNQLRQKARPNEPHGLFCDAAIIMSGVIEKTKVLNPKCLP